MCAVVYGLSFKYDESALLCSGYIHSEASMYVVLGGNVFLPGLQLYWGSLIIKGLLKKVLPIIKPSVDSLLRGLMGKVGLSSASRTPCAEILTRACLPAMSLAGPVSSRYL